MDNSWQEVNTSIGEAWDGLAPIQGIYVGLETGVGKNKSNLYQLKVGDENVSVWGSTVLDSAMGKVGRGMEVRIEPLGKKVSKTGSEYKDYKVMQRPAPFQEVSPIAPTTTTYTGRDDGDPGIDVASIEF